jgi:hypothetical protein
MSADVHNFILTPARPAAGFFGQAGRFLLLGLVLFSIAFSGYMGWQWLDRNLLHWGIEDGKVTVFDDAQIIERIRAFEVITVKHTYDASTSIDVSKDLNAGPARVALPGWIAGQDMRASAQVEVAAGVDLSAVTVSDIEVFYEAETTRVLVRIPAPQLFSRQLLPDTMDMDTSQGVLTRLKTRLGGSEKDLRDQAADRLAVAAETSALENGILTEAGVEAKLRLGRFLNDVASATSQNVVYVVEVVDVPVS